MCLFSGLTLEILPKVVLRHYEEHIEGFERNGGWTDPEEYEAWATPPYWRVFAPLLCIGSSCSVVF